MSGWFGTSNPEVDGPLQGMGAGYARRRNAQRRRYDPLGRAVIFEDPEANNQGGTGPSDPGEVARFNRKKAEQEMANTYMPAMMPRDFTVGGYTVRATFNPQLQNYIVSVLHGMGTMEKHTYSKNEGQAAINKHAQLASLAKKVAKYDTQTPKIVEKTNYNVALEVKTGGVAKVYDQIMEFLGLGAVTPERGSTTAEVDTSILRRIEERNGFQETPNQVPREITARTTVMDRKIITQPDPAPPAQGRPGMSTNWKAMRQKSFRVVVIRKDRTEVFSSNWDGDYDKTVALFNSTVATITNSPDFYDQQKPVVLPVPPANGGGGDITDPIKPGPVIRPPGWEMEQLRKMLANMTPVLYKGYQIYVVQEPDGFKDHVLIVSQHRGEEGKLVQNQKMQQGLGLSNAKIWIDNITRMGITPEPVPIVAPKEYIVFRDGRMLLKDEGIIVWMAMPEASAVTAVLGDPIKETHPDFPELFNMTIAQRKAWIAKTHPLMITSPPSIIEPVPEPVPIVDPIDTSPIDTPPESSENYNDMTVDTREIVPGPGDSTGYTPQPLSTYQTETLEQNEWVIRQQAESNAVASQSMSNQKLLGVGLIALAGAMYISRE